MSRRDPVISDPERLAAVKRSGMFDTPPTAAFDRIATLAARLLNAPKAYVTVLDDERQFLKSAMVEGKRAEGAGTAGPVEHSFCQYTVGAGAAMIVPDARIDERLKDSPSVAAGILSYAGVPLMTSDRHAIGALCVVDSQPREWSEEDIENLNALALSVMKLMDDQAEAPDGSAGGGARSTLVECINHHFDALKEYESLVAPGHAIDLTREGEKAIAVERSLAGLREAFAKVSAQAPAADRELARKVGSYLESDERRRSASRSFTEGHMELAELKRAISAHIDAADLLRIASIDFGVAP